MREKLNHELSMSIHNANLLIFVTRIKETLSAIWRIKALRITQNSIKQVEIMQIIMNVEVIFKNSI